MPVRLFILKGVPDDEAEDIRQLLDRYQINYYETPAGNWGMSLPAIWLPDESQHEEAYNLIAKYQLERRDKARHEYQQLKREGKSAGFLAGVREDPVRAIVLLLIIALLLYLSIKPFISIGK